MPLSLQIKDPFGESGMIFRYRSARRKLFGSVHADQLTGNVFSAGAAQENREMRNVLRFSDMLQTAQSFDRFFPVAAEPDPGAGRVDVAGNDAVHRNAVMPEFFREQTGVLMNRGFCHGMGGETIVPVLVAAALAALPTETARRKLRGEFIFGRNR